MKNTRNIHTLGTDQVALYSNRFYYIEIIELSWSNSMLQQSSSYQNHFHRSKSTLKNNFIQHPQNLQIVISKVYLAYWEAKNLKQQVKQLWKLIKLCYNNKRGQIYLSKMLFLPQSAGPISLNSIPNNILDHNQKVGEETTQLQFLFDFLINVKESYFCWVIYYSEQLKVLNLKLLRQDQLPQFEELFNLRMNLVGIFSNRQQKASKPQFNDGEANDFAIQDQNLWKIHVRSTLNNSTGSSWKHPHLKIPQYTENISKFKFRSTSPKFTASTKVSNTKDDSNDQSNTIKISKSLSVMSRVAKSKSSLHKYRFDHEKPKISENNCTQSNPAPFKMLRVTNPKRKLKKESKFHRIQQIYQKAV